MAVANKIHKNSNYADFQIVNEKGEKYEIITELKSTKSNMYCFQIGANAEEDLKVACIDKKNKHLFYGDEAIKLIQIDHN